MIKCPYCKKQLKTIKYVKDMGYEIWEYPIKKKQLDFDNGDMIKSNFENCHYECPECEKSLSETDTKKMGIKF